VAEAEEVEVEDEEDVDVEEAEDSELELELELVLVTKLNEVKTDPMGPVAEVLIVAAELADKKLFFYNRYQFTIRKDNLGDVRRSRGSLVAHSSVEGRIDDVQDAIRQENVRLDDRSRSRLVLPRAGNTNGNKVAARV
jgi:hypothetical protein